MKMSAARRQSIGYTVAFIFLVTFVVTGILSGFHVTTSGRVAENERLRYELSVLEAMGVHGLERDEISTSYARLRRTAIALPGEREAATPAGLGDAQASESTPVSRVLYLAAERDVVAMPFVGPGVWGDISVVISVTTDLQTIVGLSILDQNETPGLGGRITEDEFLAQFRGERLAEHGIALRRGSGDTDARNASVDAISGATGSSRALHTIVNGAIATLRTVLASTEVAMLP